MCLAPMGLKEQSRTLVGLHSSSKQDAWECSQEYLSNNAHSFSTPPILNKVKIHERPDDHTPAAVNYKEEGEVTNSFDSESNKGKDCLKLQTSQNRLKTDPTSGNQLEKPTEYGSLANKNCQLNNERSDKKENSTTHNDSPRWHGSQKQYQTKKFRCTISNYRF